MDNRFRAAPSKRPEGWTDPGPRLSASVEMAPPSAPVAVVKCPDPVICCDDLTAAREAGLIAWQNVAPFRADVPTAPTAYLLSDGGHGGMAPIVYCPFCGSQISFQEVPYGRSA